MAETTVDNSVTAPEKNISSSEARIQLGDLVGSAASFGLFVGLSVDYFSDEKYSLGALMTSSAVLCGIIAYRSLNRISDYIGRINKI